MSLFVVTYYGYSGCNNEPDKNNGDCTYASGKNGNTYFCEDSMISHDCVKKGAGDEKETLG